MPTNWTLEQILGLAPDRFIAKSSRSLAFLEKWQQLNRSDRFIWGDFPQINRDAVQAAVDINGPAFFCSCRSLKAPCRHSLALLQLLILQPDSFPEGEPPVWVTGWIKRATKPASHSSGSAENSAEEQERFQKLQSGIAELAIWLEDMVRDGLSKVAERPKETWDRMANRLIDAQAGLLALRIKALELILKKNDQWPEPFLRECGALYLLTQSFARFDALSEGQQIDLRTAVGWLPKIFDEQVLIDHWQVVGRKTSQISRQYYYRTWLWSAHHQRPALVARATHSRLGGASLLTTGEMFHGSMAYAASGHPLMAERRKSKETAAAEKFVQAGESVQEALKQYQNARNANPWLHHFPFMLKGVWPERLGDSWFIVDDQTIALPLSTTDSYIWHLLALSGGNPITLFGEWDGHAFWPLAVQQWGRWIDCHALGGNIQ